WFLFVGRGTGEVLAHFARIDGTFVVHHAAADVVFESRDIRDLVDRVLVFPDRTVGRASGDALYSHLVVTAAALGLSLEALSEFLDRQEIASAPADDAPEPPVAPDSVASWTLPDEPDGTAGDETVAGDGTEDDAADAGPEPQVEAVEVDADAGASVDTPVASEPVVAGPQEFDVPPLQTTEEADFVPVRGSFDGVVLEGGGADDTLVGTGGADFLAGGDGRDLILAGAGDDVVLGGRGDDTVLGGDGNDLLAGGDGDDHLHGGQGNDLLLGGQGNDLLYGGKGDDTLQGFSGNDTLSGDSGDDLLLASDGDAVLIGGSGTNIFHFAPGEAVAYAGEDRDIFVYEEGERSDVVIRDFDPDKDELYYLDPNGRREIIDLLQQAVDGEVVINASLGGRLTILFDDGDAALT
ncbi:calcium-binding protein, partial [Stella sp.]|uniref:calcium-binding protein n=1 Tax=Stella sp. TaxID=2912054 RepID=UPI0035AED44B